MDVGLIAGAVVVGAVSGAIVMWLVMRTRAEARIAAAVTQVQAPMQIELATLAERASRIPTLEGTAQNLEKELGEARKANNIVGEERATLQAIADRVPDLEAKLQGAEAERNRLATELAALQERFEAEQKNVAEKLVLLGEAKEALVNQFKTLASEILEEKSKRFTDQNQANINQLLEPLRTKLGDFQAKVEQVHVDGGKERFALAEQVKQLVALNQTLSEDAKNLTSALKGSAKSQGSWGELILERVLEMSGLRKGEEYVAQESKSTDEGKRFQPDVVIKLPEDRCLVVDSKVSLVAYERYASAELDDERAVALRQHLESVRGHVKSLADKNYQALYGVQSPDFVLLFVPIEPAFMLAVANDRELFMDAWKRNVLLVSPSTLLFVVRTVAHLWRQEAQSRNAQDIASRGGELYDKLVGFVGDLMQIGKELKSAQAAYEEAEKKLSAGRGNVIRQAEMLRDLGVKPTKHLPRQLVDRALPNDSIIPIALVAPDAGTGDTVELESPVGSGDGVAEDPH